MQTLKIQGSNTPYEILIEKNIKNQLAKHIRQVSDANTIVLVTDEQVHSIYQNLLRKLIQEFDGVLNIVTIPSGEKSKSTNTLSYLYNEYMRCGISKSDLIVAFGGGVVGDITGYSAATFLRGVPYIQIPTTLTSQIDSSVGGKTAINLPSGKNLVGSFYHPIRVIIDPTFLETLHIRVLRDGLAEAIKYGCIKDRNLFDLLLTLNEKTLFNHIEDIIYTCCKIKKEVVEEDEFDNGIRMILNFGHTIGHGVEEYYDYQHITHGEGVAIGMYQITKNSEKMGLTPNGTASQVKSILDQYNLPSSLDQINKNILLETMTKDKKVRGKAINLVLLNEIGSCFIHKILLDELNSFVQ